ncbi:MAG: hypothetical protein GW794_14365, partial [Flavobacteriales bacterium]|nr:hypothetical protein [Flavobacteriales bacterium]
LKTNATVTLLVDGNWSLGANWSSGSVPTSGDDVVVPAGKSLTVDILGAVTNNFTIDATASAVINPGSALMISGIFTNNGTLTVNSDATGSGSVIAAAIGGGSGFDFYQRYLTGGTNWHLISSPLAFAKISNFITDNGAVMTKSGVNYSLGIYDNTKTLFVDTWVHYTTDGTNPPPSDAFTPGKGYEVLMDNSGTVLFNGAVKTGNASVAVTQGNTTWNLIGNPYTSFMFANSNSNGTNFLSTNAANLDPSFIAFYVWNPTNNAYDLINQASGAYTFAPGQGFFIKSKTGGATIDFTTSMQTNSGNLFQKAHTTGIPTIVLSADNNNGVITNTEIKYMGGTSLG